MVKRQRPPQWHLLFTAGGLLAAVVVAISVSDLPSLPASDKPTKLNNLRRPAAAPDAASLRRIVATQVDSVLSDLGISPRAVSRRGEDAGASDTITVRVPADLPVASVNGALTQFVSWHGGSVVRGEERQNADIVHVAFGIDSTTTTLFRLRRDRNVRRNAGDIALIVDLQGAPPARVQRLTQLHQPLTLAGPRTAADDGEPTVHEFLDQMPQHTVPASGDSLSAADLTRWLWALAEQAANEGGARASVRLHPATLDALEQTLPRLERRGYRFVTLAEFNH